MAVCVCAYTSGTAVREIRRFRMHGKIDRRKKSVTETMDRLNCVDKEEEVEEKKMLFENNIAGMCLINLRTVGRKVQTARQHSDLLRCVCLCSDFFRSIAFAPN